MGWRIFGVRPRTLTTSTAATRAICLKCMTAQVPAWRNSGSQGVPDAQDLPRFAGRALIGDRATMRTVSFRSCRRVSSVFIALVIR